MRNTRRRGLSRPAPVYQRIRDILESARAAVARSVNTTQVVANWLVGREIVEEEQRGEGRARAHLRRRLPVARPHRSQRQGGGDLRGDAAAGPGRRPALAAERG